MSCSTNDIDVNSMYQEDLVSCQADVKIVKVVPLPHARSEVWSYFGFIADDDGEIHDKKKTICKICGTILCYSGNTTNLFTHLNAMHPEVNPQKLAPTNKAPRTGKKSNKRKLTEETDNLLPIELDSNSHFIMRNLQINQTLPTKNDSIATKNLNCNLKQNDHQTILNTSSVNISQTNNNQIIQSNELLKQTTKQNTSFNSINQLDLNQNSINNSDEITNAIVNLIARDCRPIELVTGKHFQNLIKLLAPKYKMPDSVELEQLVKEKLIDIRRELIFKSMDD